MNDQGAAHFSNAVLQGYLDYVRSCQNGSRYEAFVEELGADETWLRDSNAWHDIGFHTRFLATLKKVFPENPDVIFDGARFLYTQRKLQRFTSLARLLLRPELIYSRLPAVVSRMDNFNKYEFRMERSALTYSRGRLSIRYGQPIPVELCDAARGSTTGIMQFLGYRLISIVEPRCVRRGDDRCELSITWVNQPFLRHMLLWAFSSTAAAACAVFFINLPWAISLLGGIVAGSVPVSAYVYSQMRRSLHEAFDYQQDIFTDLRKLAADNQNLSQSLLEYQRQLAEAMAMVSWGEMSYSLVHDMATPVQLILMYSQQLSLTVQDASNPQGDVLKTTAAIQEATKRLLQIQNIFRSMIKGQRNRDLQPSNVSDLRTLARTSVDLFRPLLKLRDIELVFDSDPTPIPVRAPQGAVESVMLNLVQNAVRAMEEVEAKTLRIAVRLADGRGCIEVADSGPGIPQERLAELWERFGYTRPDHDRSHAASAGVRGSGFGLFDTKGTVDRLGGTISVRTSSAGTTFEVSLPVSEGASAATNGDQEPAFRESRWAASS